MRIGPIDLSKEVMIIAEIGNNHEGDLALAQEMICQAARCGVQAVKFQTINPDKLVSSDQLARITQLRRYQLSEDQHHILAKTANENGVIFLSSPFSLEAVQHLDSLVPAFKVASGDNDYAQLLERIALTGKPVLLSTGMSTLEGIIFSLSVLNRVWTSFRIANPGIVIMHCVSAYPTPAVQANLSALREISDLGYTVGYSDHTLGIEAAVLSVALGARVIEKHFTLSKKQSDFRDHSLSVEPHELKLLVEQVKKANVLLGDGKKRVMQAEEATSHSARRSVYALTDLEPGHILSLDDLICLRPAGGVPASKIYDLVGRQLNCRVDSGEQLSYSKLAN